MAKAVSIRFDFRDDKGKESFTKIRVPTTFSIADYVEFAQAAAQLFANGSQGTITRCSICFDVSLAGLGLDTIPGALSSVAKKLAMRFSTAVTGFFAKTLIPGHDELNIIAGSEDANQAASPIAAAISMFEDGIAVTGGTMQFTNDREHDVTAVIEAKEQFRKRKSA